MFRKKSRKVERPVRLSDTEYLILSALSGQLREGLYGLEIRSAIHEEQGVELPFGSLYVLLGRLGDKGFVERVDGDHVGNLRRVYYRITPRGAAAARAKANFFAPGRAVRAGATR